MNDNLETCYENLKKLLSLDEEDGDSNELAIKEGNYSIVSKVNSEILLQSETTEAEKGTASMLALDLSSLTGGAPGRTRGLQICAVNSS